MSHWNDLWSKRKNEKVVIGPNDPLMRILYRFDDKYLDPWIFNVEGLSPRIVEFGCGQGLRTIIFCKEKGYNPILVDSSKEALLLAHENAKYFDMPIVTMLNDVFHYKGKEKEMLVWSAGLNEHFIGADRINIFKVMKEASSKYVLVIVPNSHNVFYRMTKWYREKRGTWPFGEEYPFSPKELKSYAELGGLKVLESGGLGAYLSFYRWFFLGSKLAPKLLNKPTPFGILNKWLINKDLSFDSKINKLFGREIYIIAERIN